MRQFSQLITKFNKFFFIDRLLKRIEANLLSQLLICLLISFACLYLLSNLYTGCADDFVFFYGEKLRGFLFSGFLTVGSFLLSLKTFVVVNLKDKLFDSESYKNKYRAMNALGAEDEIDYKDLYKPLANLTGFLFFAILFSILTAVSQFSLGLLNDFYYVMFCIWMAVFTATLLLNSLRLIRSNLLVWLGYK
ncbi:MULTISPECIES: hypothetical protein [unclassified Halomonas]|uniref:hypothetical protein n=1 Tax=unclassified Halomonas TaxID=2609666 RepID=UPI001EF5263E|nr:MULTISPECIES: hypothetical protein [unclassified Halomonas]MCG7576491.1 hypothetical protein [Halomonas sp. MMH1-48]MCG7603554.1 hypothetical protein [Halomonas sp. MM17-34]MCG7612974.1 hypothetical protein [Halomonas sp. MM17-29]MCG7619405.1 hypothetical protein [Halomonas sp. DSH1-27]